MSVLVDSAEVSLPIERWPLVSLCMALAVSERANDLIGKPSVVLKWPNDVVVLDEPGLEPLGSGVGTNTSAQNALGYRKLAGILVEVSSGRLVVGVGVNLTRPLEVDPSLGVAARPIWLSELTDRAVERDAFATAVVDRFFRYLGLLCTSPQQLLERYRAVVATIGWTVSIESHGRVWSARAVDVDDHGRLVVEDDSGTHHLDVSEIVHVRPTAV